ncbi:oligosaccharide flippase family protein [Marilutibacter spongiae]|uniref:Oligosaccharide flippase family protein n=1 Tax=Marilutibacter spongiae TaxID=2025720 RepID=A0A7W3TN91_9GAMM|nr:oligosaccharide flippase family protein [Lysobacter spongiae]MBB1061458.1 oligosaccharide flippase family protein [Lysobacter spongiae]
MSRDALGVATHYRRYATGNALTLLAGLVSFPLLTRLLDNTQYGMFGYYGAWILMAIAVGKFGAQHAILRFYPHDGGARELRAFATNLFYVPLGLAFVVWALVVAGMVLVDAISGERQGTMFWLVVAMAPMAVFSSLVDTVQKVTERSQLVMYLRISSRWVELLLMLGAVLLVQASAVAAYSGKLATTLLFGVFYILWMRRHLNFSRADINLSETRAALMFGMPMALSEIISVTLVSLDRWMLKDITGDFALVGVYSIGSSLAMQVSLFMNASVFEAFLPTANRVYVTEGDTALRELKSRVLVPMTYGAACVAVLLGLFGSDLILVASGVDKIASGPIFSLLAIVCVLQPVLLLAGYGLLLEKRSKTVLALVFLSLLLNGVLNYLWIPAHGVMGAAWATVASSSALGLAHCVVVKRSLLCLPDRRSILGAAVAVALVVLFERWLDRQGMPAGWARLLLGGGSAGSLYLASVLVLDARARELVRGVLRSARGRVISPRSGNTG